MSIIETNKICSYLNKYYDCVVFNNLSDIISSTFDESTKNQNVEIEKNKNITLIRLIQNYYRPYPNIISNV